MARTWSKAGLSIHAPSSTHLDLSERELPEGASQTWKAGELLSASSGLLVSFVAPATAKVAAFALNDGQNTSGKLAKVVLLSSDMEFYANVLTSSAADYVLLAADTLKPYDLAKATNFPTTGAAQWYLQNTTADVSAAISELQADQVPPTERTDRPAAGDTNARVRIRILPAARLF